MDTQQINVLTKITETKLSAIKKHKVMNHTEKI